LLKLIGPEHSSKPYNRFHKFSEFVAQRGRKNMAFALKDHRFGRLYRCAAVLIFHWNDIVDFLACNDVRNLLGCTVYNFTQQSFFKFFLLPLALVGIHVVEPFLRLVLDKNTSHQTLLTVFPRLHEELCSKTINIDSLDECKISSLADKFTVQCYPDEWIEVMRIELNNLDVDTRTLMQKITMKFKKTCGHKLEAQRGGAYEFGNPKNHIYPVREQIPAHMLESAVVHNLASESKFGELDYRLRKNGPSTFKRVSNGLVKAMIQIFSFFIQILSLFQIIRQNEDLSFKNYDPKILRKLQSEIVNFEKEFEDSQKEILINGVRVSQLDSLRISQDQKLIKLRNQLQEKYKTFLPTTVASLEEFMKKVNAKEEGKVLRSLVKLAKHDFKSLKSDNVLFKQRIPNEQIFKNLSVLFGNTHDKTGIATIKDIKDALDKL
jgi:hypothetical protein